MKDILEFGNKYRNRYVEDVYKKNKHKKIDSSLAIKKVKEALNLLADIEAKENHLHCYDGDISEEICNLISLLVFNIEEEALDNKLKSKKQV